VHIAKAGLLFKLTQKKKAQRGGGRDNPRAGGKNTKSAGKEDEAKGGGGIRGRVELFLNQTLDGTLFFKHLPLRQQMGPRHQGQLYGPKGIKWSPSALTSRIYSTRIMYMK